jgi:hypothetical protein
MFKQGLCLGGDASSRLKYKYYFKELSQLKKLQRSSITLKLIKAPVILYYTID